MKKVKFSIVVTLLLFTFFSCRESTHFLHKALYTIKYWSGDISAASFVEANSNPDLQPNGCDSAFNELESGGSYSVHGDIFNARGDTDEAPDFDSDISNEITKVLSKSAERIQTKQRSCEASPVANNSSFEVIKLLEGGN